MSTHKLIAPLVGVLFLPLALFAQQDDRYDPDRALEISQSAVGKRIGDYELHDHLGAPVRLRSDHSGRPLVISMIFTSCHHVCPQTTKHLATAVEAAREALGTDSFDVVTIGFDVAHDTPSAMGAFARKQGVSEPGWRFLSASKESIEALSNDLGFIFFPTARGFDHIVFNRPNSAGHLVAGLVDRVMLFCTVYDPTTGRYRFDNSLFVQIFAGGTFILALVIYLVREIILARRARKSE
jgi:protein SCO1/2